MGISFPPKPQADALDHLSPAAGPRSDASSGRCRRAAAERFGWGAKPPEGHGVGLACGAEKGGYIATCAEVAVDRQTGKVRVVRAVVAFECGAIVNPDGLLHVEDHLRAHRLRGDHDAGPVASGTVHRHSPHVGDERDPDRGAASTRIFV